jgi:hypothetical protein
MREKKDSDVSKNSLDRKGSGLQIKKEKSQ